MKMRLVHWFGVSLYLGLVLCASEASAQPFVIVDAGAKSFGIEPGAFFGRGKIQPGVSVGAFHSYDLSAPKPDLEALALLSAGLGRKWAMLAGAGGGATRDQAWSASVRGLFVITQTSPVAFRASSFVMWTPATSSWFIQPRLGPSIRLPETEFRIFPHLAVNIATPGIEAAIDVHAAPGCTLFFFW